MYLKQLAALLARAPQAATALTAVVAVFNARQLQLSAPPNLLTSGLNNLNVLLTLEPMSKCAGQGACDNSSEHCAASQWVLRCNTPQPLALRQQEVQAWQAAASAQLAPPLLWHSEDYQLFISEYCPSSCADIFGQGFAAPAKFTSASDWLSAMAHQGSTISSLKLERAPPSPKITFTEPLAPHLAALLTMLLQLSRLPLPQRHMSTGAQIEGYLQALMQRAPSARWPVAEQQRWYQAQTQVMQYWQVNSKRLAVVDKVLTWSQFSHRDLHPDNLLWRQGQVYCLDFEFCCAGHPLWDLTSIVATCQLPPRQASTFCGRYLQAHPHLTLAHIELMPAMLDSYWFTACCWALNQARDTQSLDCLDWFDSFWQVVTK
ncbi:phosphotransferase family protein [Shewanella sp. NIFS-20-20]|uniref:phosphotransferase family protein n=1 Tax=Shewanella sp. NIFS-20-20 TaxID=2853806 RepID=UPI001C48A00E|nr:aminoglycoside phosphotransferase family protein [Shewanella sp. NIFS-20-20]MBV7317099.1 aminoglycoside phosphotransferase family protein [Shewanella sp. NIFS-20-20]